MSASDIALLERWVEHKDAEAFRELVERYSSMVYTTCLRILKDSMEAQDISQECFLELITLGEKCRKIRSAGGLLHSLATRRSIDRIRKNSRRLKREQQVAEVAPDEMDAIIIDDVQVYVDEAINDLPEKLREPIIGHFLEGHSHQAVAKKLGIPRTTVTSRITKGIDEVRKKLKKRGIPITTSALASLFTVEAAQAAPPALTAALGKIALSEGAAASIAGSTTVTTGLVLAGGITVMKTFITAAIAIVIIALVVITTHSIGQKDDIPQFVVQEETEADSNIESEENSSFKGSTTEDSQISTAKLTSNGKTGRYAEGLRVSGIVVDSEGNPIDGAKVLLRIADDRESEIETITESDGIFTFYGLSPNKYVLRAHKEGMRRKPGSNDGIINLIDTDADNLEMILYNLGSVEGKVFGSFLRPVRDKRIVARWLDCEEPIYIAEETTTDKHGNFMISGMLPGRHALSITTGDFRNDIVDLQIDLKEGEHKTGVRIKYAGDDHVIAGRVTDEEGKPIEGILVQVVVESNTLSVNTDAEGKYRFTRLPEGSYQMMSVTNYGYKSHWASDIETGREDVDIVLTSLPFAEISGRVIDKKTREPVTDFRLRARNGIYKGIKWGARFEQIHDEEGRFTLDDVNIEKGTIIVQAPGYETSFHTIQLVDGEEPEEVLIPLSKGHVIEGKVVNSEGKPVPGAWVLTKEFPPLNAWKNDGVDYIKSQMDEIAAIISGEDGTFVLKTLPNEPFTITAYHLDHGFGALQVVPFGSKTKSAKIVLSMGGKVEGVVTIGDEPVGNAFISIWHTGLMLPQGSAKTGPDGHYSITEIVDGEVQISMQPPESSMGTFYRSAHRYKVLIKSGETANVDFNMAPGVCKVVGNVTMMGEPVKDGRVELMMDMPDGTEYSRRGIGINGRFVFWDMPVGPSTISIMLTDENGERREKKVDIDIPDNDTVEVDIDLSGNGVISGSVSGLDAFELGIVTAYKGEITIREYNNDIFFEIQDRSQGWSQITDDGTFIIRGLNPGTYTIVARASTQYSYGTNIDEARFDAAIVEIGKDEEINLDLTLH